MRRYHVRLMVSVLVSLSAVASAGEGGRGVMAQSAQDETPETLLEVEGVLESGDLSFDDGSFYDVYSFIGVAGQEVSITLESLDFDTYLLLFNPAGEKLAENDDIDLISWETALVLWKLNFLLFVADLDRLDSAR